MPALAARQRLVSWLAWAGCLGVAGMPATLRATSAEVHGPVELQLNGTGTLCAHVRPGYPNEARQGWSVQLWTSQSSAPVWEKDVEAGRVTPAWPDALPRCMALPVPLQSQQPYTIEISSIRLYRSQFCWQPAAHGLAARLLAVDDQTSRCSAQDWVGQDGHALTTRGWWSTWRQWWQEQFGRP